METTEKLSPKTMALMKDFFTQELKRQSMSGRQQNRLRNKITKKASRKVHQAVKNSNFLGVEVAGECAHTDPDVYIAPRPYRYDIATNLSEEELEEYILAFHGYITQAAGFDEPLINKEGMFCGFVAAVSRGEHFAIPAKDMKEFIEDQEKLKMRRKAFWMTVRSYLPW